jgi:hypothetical protein
MAFAKITSDEALTTARLDAEKAYRDLSPYRVMIELHVDGWHVDYELRNQQHQGGGAHYVIDAQSGAIRSSDTSNSVLTSVAFLLLRDSPAEFTSTSYICRGRWPECVHPALSEAFSDRPYQESGHGIGAQAGAESSKRSASEAHPCADLEGRQPD